MSEMTPEAVKDRVLRRMPGYLREGIENQDGIEAVAAVFSRLHGRIDQETRSAGLIEEAAGAARAETTATVTWPAMALSAPVVLATGDAIAATAWGVEFVVPGAKSSGLTFTAAGGSVTGVPLEAVWAGIEGNVPGWAIVWTDPEDWGEWLGVDVDVAIVKAAIADGSIIIEADDSAGGVTGWLDLHAADRGLPRTVDEEDAALRRRLRTLPNIVTPVDIEAAAQRLVQPFNATARVSEWWEHAFTWGVSGWGVDAWARMRSAVVLVQAISPGDDMSVAIAAVENYLSRARPFGVWVQVVEEIP